MAWVERLLAVASGAVEGLEVAFERDLPVRGVDPLPRLVPVDGGGLEVEREPARGSVVGRRGEPLVLDEGRPVVGVGLEDQPKAG